MALRRAISNLLQNSQSYAETAQARLRVDGDEVEIIIDDNGPGIPAGKYEDAFRPFSRLDSARTQNVPGVGLGLALVRDTVRSHGGSITLGRAPIGGLRAALRLPL